MVKLHDNLKILFDKYFKTILEPPCLNKMDGGRTFYMTAYWRMCNAQSLTFSLQYCMHHLFLFIDESNCKLSDELLIPIIKLIAMYVVVWITWWLVLGSFYYHLDNLCNSRYKIMFDVKQLQRIVTSIRVSWYTPKTNDKTVFYRLLKLIRNDDEFQFNLLRFTFVLLFDPEFQLSLVKLFER